MVLTATTPINLDPKIIAFINKARTMLINVIQATVGLRAGGHSSEQTIYVCPSVYVFAPAIVLHSLFYGPTGIQVPRNDVKSPHYSFVLLRSE